MDPLKISSQISLSKSMPAGKTKKRTQMHVHNTITISIKIFNKKNSIDAWIWYLIWLEIWMFSSVEFSIRWKCNDEPQQLDVWCEINLTIGRSVTSENDLPQSMFIFQFFSFFRFDFNLSLFSFSYSTNLSKQISYYKWLGLWCLE